jgi:hypothetical protein
LSKITHKVLSKHNGSLGSTVLLISEMDYLLSNERRCSGTASSQLVSSRRGTGGFFVLGDPSWSWFASFIIRAGQVQRNSNASNLIWSVDGIGVAEIDDS